MEFTVASPPIVDDSISWDPNNTQSSLTVVDPQTLEWSKDSPAAWLCAATTARLGKAKYKLEFRVEEIKGYQMGVGFLVFPIDWGFYRYLGAGSNAYSYDPFEGAIVTQTEAIHSNLAKIANSGVITLELDLEGPACTAKFVVDGEDTPVIQLPDDAVVMPAACLLMRGQKVVLHNFTKL
jgi:hypothetical protein